MLRLIAYKRVLNHETLETSEFAKEKKRKLIQQSVESKLSSCNK